MRRPSVSKIAKMAQCGHPTWKVVHKKKGCYRICNKCKMKILMIPSPKGSFLEDYPVIKNLRPKGRHRTVDDKYDN